MQSTTERRMELLEYMCEKRHDTIEHLAYKFEVSKRTIRYDVEVLSLSYPIYSQTGKGGGVFVTDTFHLFQKHFNQEQRELLEKLAPKLTGDDARIMQDLLNTFSFSGTKKEVKQCEQ